MFVYITSEVISDDFVYGTIGGCTSADKCVSTASLLGDLTFNGVRTFSSFNMRVTSGGITPAELPLQIVSSFEQKAEQVGSGKVFRIKASSAEKLNPLGVVLKLNPLDLPGVSGNLCLGDRSRLFLNFVEQTHEIEKYAFIILLWHCVAKIMYKKLIHHFF